MKASKPGKRRVPRLAIVIGAALAASMLLAVAVAHAIVYWTPQYDWYDGSGSYTLPSSAGGMQALSTLVNGTYDPEDLPESVRAEHTPAAPISFEGETITLSNAGHPFFTFRDNTWKYAPIGDSAEHVFEGTFDGDGNSVSGLFLSNTNEDSQCGLSYIGLFGHVGEHGTVKNFTVNDTCSIDLAVSKSTQDAASQHIAYVGTLVGYCEGSIENCTSYATITVSWDDDDGGDTRSLENAVVIDGVAGIAGYCDGNLSDCTYKGYISVNTPANGYYDKANSENLPVVVKYVGGICGRSGGNPAAAGLGVHGDIANCTNEASISVTTSGAGGKDRFGETVQSKSYAIGGVAGHAIGNITNCANTGDIVGTSYIRDYAAADEDNTAGIDKADGGGSCVGGIVGAYRYGTDNTRSAETQAIKAYRLNGITVDRGIKGASENGGTKDIITISGCTNTGEVVSCDTNGGIAGGAGTYTLITACANGDAKKVLSDDSVGRVKSTRWNKPCTGGIVGNNRGDISYCRNHGEVTTTKIGYYVGGIVGDSYFYADSDRVPYATPEIWGCYTTGQITTNYGYRRGAIAGGNGGYIHDCIYLYGVSSAGEEEDSVVAIGDDTGRGEGESRNISVAYASETSAAAYRGMCLKGSQAVAWLNASCPRDQWAHSWLVNSKVNQGFPVLAEEGWESDGSVDLGAVTVTAMRTANARYTTSYNPTPTVSVSVQVGSESIELVELADYYIEADSEALGEDGLCKGVTKGTPYTAHIHGLGSYNGIATTTVAYGIDKGDFTECSVYAKGSIYSGEAQLPSLVEVRDASGGIVKPEDYTYTVNNGDPCVEAKTYSVIATANKGANYAGFINGNYQISKVDLARDVDVVGLIWENRVWLYDDELYKLYEAKPILDGDGNLTYYGADFGDGSFEGYPQLEGFEQYANEDGRMLTRATPAQTDEDGQPVYGMAVDYTAGEINPEVIAVRWGGKSLTFHNPNFGVYGQYDIIYGGGAGGSNDASSAEANIEARTIGSVTVYYAAWSYTRNYAVMTFDINAVEATATDISVSQSITTLMSNDGMEPKDVAATVVYKGNVVNPSNYSLVPDYSINSEGERHSGNDITYNIDDEVYYTVHFKDGSSISCPDIKGKLRYIITDGKKDINASSIQVEIDDEGLKWQLKGVRNPEVTVTDNEEGRRLVEGQDFELYWDYEAADPGELVLHSHLPRVTVKGLDAYRGYRTETFHIEVGEITAANFDRSSPSYYEQLCIVNGSFDGPTYYNGATKTYERMQNVASRWGENEDGTYSPISLQTYERELPYVKGGLDAESLGDLLYLEWRSDENYASQLDATSPYGAIGKTYGLGGLRVVRIIEKATGNQVEHTGDVGVYTLTVKPDSDSDTVAYRMRFADEFSLDIDFRVAPIDLSCLGTERNVIPPYASYRIPVALGYHFNNIDENGNNTSSELVDEDRNYPYTGNPILPKYCIPDMGFAQALRLGKTIDYNQHAITNDDLDVFIDGYGSVGPVDSGNNYVVTKIVSNQSNPGIVGELDFEAVGWTDNQRFNIVPANLSSDAMSIKVETMSFSGEELQPKVSFALNDEECNYVEGEDYALSYANNIRPGAADSDEPPTVTITVLNKKHLTADQVDVDGNPCITVPFTIKNASVNLESVNWIVPARVALSEQGSGDELTSVRVTGTYVNADGVVVVMPEDAYQVEAGTYSGGVFTPKKTGWKGGDEIAWSITLSGEHEGYQGSALVVGESVVDADALSFSRANEEGYGLKVNVADEDVVYTGANVHPKVSVLASGAVLVEGFDYVLESENDVAAAEDTALRPPTLVVRGMGSYTGTWEHAYTIAPAPIDSCELSVEGATYSGEAIKPTAKDVRVTLAGVELPEPDYQVKADGYGENVDAGLGTLTLVPGDSGNLVGSKVVSFRIAPAVLDVDHFTVTTCSKTYAKEPIELGADDVSVVDESGMQLEFGIDFKLGYPSDHTAAGEASLWITGVGNYAGTMTTTFEITPADLSAAEVSVQEGNATDATGNATGAWPYIGRAVTPDVTVKLDGVELVENEDYYVSYDSNIDAGTANVQVFGALNTFGNAPVATFEIAPVNLSATSGARIVQAVDKYIYTGKPVESRIALMLGGLVLRTSDYVVSYSTASGDFLEGAPTACGDYVVIASAAGGNLSGGQVQAGFKVVPQDLSECKMALSSAEYCFGDDVCPEVTLTNPAGEKVDPSEYELTYNAASTVGAYGSVIVQAKEGGNYTGQKGASYMVECRLILANDVTIGNGGEYEYTGEPVVPQVAIAIKGHELVEGVDYTLAYLGDCTNVGTQTIEISCPDGSSFASNGIVVSFQIVEPSQQPDYKQPGEQGDDNQPSGQQPDGIQQGTMVEKAGATYQITGTGETEESRAVKLVKAASKTKVTVPAIVELEDGKAYRVTTIKAGAFPKKARSITLGKYITAIPAKAFKNLKKLKSVTIGASVKKIGASAFTGCKKLKTLTVKTKKLTAKQVKNCFKGLKSTSVKIKVSVGNKKANKTYIKKYKKAFAKKYSGKKVSVV